MNCTCLLVTDAANTSMNGPGEQRILNCFIGGVLDETEIKLLERGIEVKLKRLTNFPAYVSPGCPEDILEEVVWVKGEEMLQSDLFECSKMEAP